MKRVPLIVALLLALLPTVTMAQLIDPPKDDTEILTAYKQLLELAKNGGYDGHKDASGKVIDGLKTKQFVISIGEPTRLTEARLANIRESAEFLYHIQRQPTLIGSLTYGQPKITLREVSGTEITAEISAPKSLMSPSVIKWTWRLRKGLDGWRIFAAALDLSPDTGSGFGRDPFCYDLGNEERISKKLHLWG
jgi:hypothetical protein